MAKAPRPESAQSLGYFRALALLGVLGLSMALPVLFFLFLGLWLDARYGGQGLFVAGAIVLGVIAGFFGAYQCLKKELPWKH